MGGDRYTPPRGLRRGRRRLLAMLLALLVPTAVVAVSVAAASARTTRAWRHRRPPTATTSPAPPASPTGAPSTPAPPPADPNLDCTLIVPDDPLSAQGLATPYQLVATDARAGGCSESDAAQSAFVQATIVDPGTGSVANSSPLVVDRGSRPAVAPTPPQLPDGAVVGIWFGSNGGTLTLRGAGAGSLAAGSCVNGLGASLFGQYAYCNAEAFFRAADAAIAAGKLTVPALGAGRDGLPCPTTRDFSVVDQDQSDNLTATYLIGADGSLAQDTGANRKTMGTWTVLGNGSDNGLLDARIDPALGCTPWTAPDLAEPGVQSTSLALNELLAGARQGAPVALVPTVDPMVRVGGAASTAKTNLYRAGVDQPPVDAATETTRGYRLNLVTVGAPRLFKDRALTVAAASPDPQAATNLFTFLASRLQQTFVNLGCAAALGRRAPVRVDRARNGVAVEAAPDPGGSGAPSAGAPSSLPPGASPSAPLPSATRHF